MIIRVGGETAPVHPAERSGEAQGFIATGHGKQAVVTHTFEGDAAGELIERRRTPHIRFRQRLRANLRHTDRMRLRFGVLLIRDSARLHRQLFDFCQRLAGQAIENENLPGFGAEHHGWRGFTIFLREIHQARLHRDVEIPQIVMDGLIHPFLFAGGGVQRQYRRAIFVIERRTVRAPQIHRGAAHRDKHSVHRRIV